MSTKYINIQIPRKTRSIIHGISLDTHDYHSIQQVSLGQGQFFVGQLLIGKGGHHDEVGGGVLRPAADDVSPQVADRVRVVESADQARAVGEADLEIRRRRQVVDVDEEFARSSDLRRGCS